MVEVRGFEPLTSSVRGKRSAGLSYTPRWGQHVTPPASRAKPVKNPDVAAVLTADVLARPWWSDRLDSVRSRLVPRR